MGSSISNSHHSISAFFYLKPTASHVVHDHRLRKSINHIGKGEHVDLGNDTEIQVARPGAELYPTT